VAAASGLVLLGLSACAPAPDQPASLEDLLRAEYAGWSLQRAVSEYCGSSAQAAVSGDFNGDGTPDHAARLARGDQGIIVAFISRNGGFTRVLLEQDSKQAIMNQALVLLPRGSRHDIIQDDNDLPRRPMVLANDAPGGGTCESSSYVYLIDGTRVSRAFTSD
jgi:hypothetical protein